MGKSYQSCMLAINTQSKGLLDGSLNILSSEFNRIAFWMAREVDHSTQSRLDINNRQEYSVE